MRSEPSFRRPCSSGLTCANYSKTFIDVATDMSIRVPYLKAASTFSLSNLYSATSSALIRLLPIRSSLAMLKLDLESMSPAAYSPPAEVAQKSPEARQDSHLSKPQKTLLVPSLDKPVHDPSCTMVLPQAKSLTKSNSTPSTKQAKPQHGDTFIMISFSVC